uniref:General transcription factor 3C polypeptide 2 n=1 Tax=Anolis carolinensis TaxID=28377 RepID=H9GD03_ANOCA|nr:PREDICTED: general transcription factor 3C polypeptide 2 [Anolis carolinensis]|eukprot:XP_008122480.1 PREDICTED: general transcription factor 3C polypeptide 2 [Anolis carolinensis]
MDPRPPVLGHAMGVTARGTTLPVDAEGACPGSPCRQDQAAPTEPPAGSPPKKTRGPEDEEEEAPHGALPAQPEDKKEEEEVTPQEEQPDELHGAAAPVLGHPEEAPSAVAPPRPKGPRGRKPRKGAPGRRGGRPKSSGGAATSPGPSLNGPSLPAKVPKKRGRKSKAELLLLKLAQGLEAPEPLPPEEEKMKGLDATEDGLETTPGGRPKRRAAKVALLYLQELAEELSSVCQAPPCSEASEDAPKPEEPGRKPRGRKPRRDTSEEDADFVPPEEGLLQEEEEEEDEEYQEEEEEEDEEDVLLSEASESELEPGVQRAVTVAPAPRPKTHCRGFAPNGLHNSIMIPVWKSLSVTHQFRERFHSPWEFPEWVPSARKWACLSESEAEEYLPRETKSPLFSIRREGLQEDSSVLYRVNRFSALPPHPERLDMTFFVGGPVWALEWCPTPEGALASQHLALYCHPGMEDQHHLSGTHLGPALLQLWEVGALQQDAGSATKPGLAFAIATDHGCIWDLKFCPSGAWEPPSVRRKAPQMSRLGLLAAAFSDGQVLLYSLPHPEALRAQQTAQVTGSGGLSPRHAIYKVQCVASLQVSSIQAEGSSAECGQCFSLAWLPSRPHLHLAASFYDGTVALWDLATTSLLLRIRQADGSLRLFPFHSFLAHDQAVRSIQWCKADSNFLVTAGNDRKIKFWDLRRLHEPVNSIKRFLSTEIAWLLSSCGVTVAQDNCYAPYGLCGIHYLDAGFLGFRAYFVAPRKGTVWSISGSDWLNTVVAGDVTGELGVAMMPDLSLDPHNVKRPSERRFPVYKADLLPRSCPLPSREGPGSGPAGAGERPRAPEGRSYSQAVAQSYLLFQDTDLRSFKSFRRKTRKHQHHGFPEAKEGIILGRLQLEAVHKVCFSPNLSCHSWVASGGHSGLVRLHCLRALVSPPSHKLQKECQAQFGAMTQADGERGTCLDSPLAPATVSSVAVS